MPCLVWHALVTELISVRGEKFINFVQWSKMWTLLKWPYEQIYKILGYYPTTINDYRFKCDPDHIWFWHQTKKGSWEPHTFKIFDKFLTLNSIYVDIGSWIGPTVIYAAKKTNNKLFCFEPDFIAYRYLLWNIQLNKLQNVVPLNVGLANQSCIRRMASFGGVLGDSMTSLIAGTNTYNSIDVHCISWSDFLKLTKLDKIDFIKIDIEGGEFELVPTMEKYLIQHKPIVYLSFHVPFLPESNREDSLNHITEIMNLYDNCYNEKMEQVNISDMKSEILNDFRSFLFF
jgi:FkbM family methyltransferase